MWTRERRNGKQSDRPRRQRSDGSRTHTHFFPEPRRRLRGVYQGHQPPPIMSRATRNRTTGGRAGTLATKAPDTVAVGRHRNSINFFFSNKQTIIRRTKRVATKTFFPYYPLFRARRTVTHRPESKDLLPPSLAATQEIEPYLGGKKLRKKITKSRRVTMSAVPDQRHAFASRACFGIAPWSGQEARGHAPAPGWTRLAKREPWGGCVLSVWEAFSCCCSQTQPPMLSNEPRNNLRSF